MPVATSETSDYVAELRFLLFRDVNFDLGHQWGTGDNGTTKSEARLKSVTAEVQGRTRDRMLYQPGANQHQGHVGGETGDGVLPVDPILQAPGYLGTPRL